MPVERIPLAEFHARLKAQGVSTREHLALVCPICETVQSMATLRRAGAPEEKLDSYFGFSCEGRFSGAGPAASKKDKSAKARKRRAIRGCDWTLGGLFRLHTLEVITDDGEAHPRFACATSEQAQELERSVA